MKMTSFTMNDLTTLVMISSGLQSCLDKVQK